jgi:ubiquinone/menaquinone biosynthesis C-methylase UbiE
VQALEKLLPLLECPETKGALELTKDGLVSRGNGTLYPFLGQTPWLFKAPQGQWLQWQGRIRSQWVEWESMQALLAEELKNIGLLPTTRERLERLHTGIGINLQNTRELFAQVLPSGELPVEVKKAAMDKVPRTQGLTSYIQNVFRDWVWGQSENEAMLECLKAVAPADWGPTLLLGAGAGRLVADLSRHFTPELLIAVDINPLLMFVARRMLEGKELTLCEFPVAPIESANAAQIQICKGEKAPGEIAWLFGDGMNPPFKPKTLGTVITPWFIDIIPQDLRAQALRLNRVLRPGGHWLNVGPLGFQDAQASRCYGRDEVLGALEEAGFEVKINEVRRIPYLQSPHSGNWRLESVLCFQAVKVKEVKEPKSYQYLPDWLMNLDEPITPTPALISTASQHRIYFEILSSIDGKNSVNVIADAMARHYQMEAGMAREALVTLLTGIWERSLKKPQ